MENRLRELESRRNKKIRIKVMPGHFATNHSHINYYIDMTEIKYTLKKAQHVAVEWAKAYDTKISVDTIVSLDGTEIIGGFLAQELSTGNSMSLSKNTNIAIVTPEFNSNGQMIFRDNTQGSIWNKNIVLTVASTTTGKTIKKAIQCIAYYSGNVRGVSAIFSAEHEVDGLKIDAIFDETDILNYKTYSYNECPDCKEKKKIDAIVISFGYSKL